MLDACKDVREDHSRICASEMKTILISLSTEHENLLMEGKEEGGRKTGQKRGKERDRKLVSTIQGKENFLTVVLERSK